jgi:hypothetical protein
MGKKKSKVSKQKQAKAKRQHKAKTALGAAVVMKKGQQQQQQLPIDGGSKRVLSSSGNGSSNNGKRALTNGKDVAINKGNKNSSFQFPSTTKKQLQQQRQPDNNDEKAAFDREMASLQERQYAKNNQGKRKSSKKSAQNDGGLVFQAPAFTLEKTSTQIMDETVNKLQTLEGIGRQQVVQQQQPIFASSSLQYASWNISQQSTTTAEKEEEPQIASKNPFAALGADSDDDSDNEWTVKPEEENKAKDAPFFAMAPPSFNFTSSFVPFNAAATSGDDIDPDL